MNSLPFSRLRNFILILSLVILAGGMGFRLGEQNSQSKNPLNQTVSKRETPKEINVDFSLFWDVWGRMFQYYIDAATLSPQKMVWGAISGMVSAAGDPYTAFFPPKENQEFKEDLGGEFQGIGAQLGIKNGRIIVIAPLKGTPAEAAGMRAADIILKVGAEETYGWTVTQAVEKIRGPRGTSVTLTILHENAQKPQELSIIRDVITVPSVESWIKDVSSVAEIKDSSLSAQLKTSKQKIAYLRLSRFGDHSNEDWLKAVGQITSAQKQSPLKGMILDLRNNPGGYLDGSVFVASEFLKNGVVVSQVNSDGSKQEYRVNRAGQLILIPLVVIINKGSASASEIVAGALKDTKRATIVGEVSFGKGSVQTPQELPDGSSVHITTGKWFTPKGTSINQTGISPDVSVIADEISETNDPQLARAIEILLK